MKTERRHELQTNVLADWIGHKTETVKPYFKLIVGAIGAVFIVAIAATVISHQQSERSSRGWADYFAAASGDSPDRLRTVAEDHAGTLPAVWAMLREADLELARGIRALYTSRGESTEAIGSAKKLYQLVEAGAAGQPVLKQAAQFGVAQAFEAEGDLEKARDNYEKAVATAKNSSIGKQSQARLDRLKNKDAAEFLAWFAKQTPQPRAPQGGFPGGFPGGDDGGLDLPRDLSAIPGRPELSVPVPLDESNKRANSSFPTNEPDAQTPDAQTPDAQTPAPSEPAPSEPATKTPAPAEPAAKTPAPAEPAAKTPAPAEPDAKTPAPAEPAPQPPAPAEPTAPKPTEPEATQPEASEPPSPAPELKPETPAATPVESPAEAPAGDSAASQ